MIGDFFVSLFKINEQADHYRLQAAKINEARMYFAPRYRKTINFYQSIGRQVRILGYSVKDFERGCGELAQSMRRVGDAIRNGLTELSKERSN